MTKKSPNKSSIERGIKNWRDLPERLKADTQKKRRGQEGVILRSRAAVSLRFYRVFMMMNRKAKNG